MTTPTEGIFGIDLGTTYSVVAYIDSSGRPTVTRNSYGDDTTPSVVYFESADNLVVGQVAKDAAGHDPDNVVALIKREMGSSDYSREFFGIRHTPESISAIILEALARDAQVDTGRDLKRAVITVPAYFGLLEKAATRQAGEIAGLEVLGIVPEPVAAALQYGMTGGADGTTVLVYDLGGGTFDISLISITEEAITVLETGGDHGLGGADWDRKLYSHLLEETIAQTGDESVRDDPALLQDILAEAERVKKALSSATSKTVVIRAGGAAAKIVVTRDQFEEMTADLLDETVRITERTLSLASERLPGIRDRIADVLLVGGSTKMPAVAVALKKEFGWDARLTDPDLAVAKGAALYAAGRTIRWVEEHGEGDGPQAADRDDVIRTVAESTGVGEQELTAIAGRRLVNVLPKAIGLKLIDTSRSNWQDDPASAAYVQHLVQAQTSLPFMAEPFVAQTVSDAQPQIEIELWEQAGSVADRSLEANKAIDQGRSVITDLAPYALPQGSPINIGLEVDDEGTVTVRAVEPHSGKQLDMRVQISVLSPEQVAGAREVHSGLSIGT